MGSGTDEPPEGLDPALIEGPTRSTRPKRMGSSPTREGVGWRPAGETPVISPNQSCDNCGNPILDGKVYDLLDGYYCSDCVRKCRHLNEGLEGGRVEPAKHDANKSRYDLIPPEGIEAIAQALTYGAGKYGPRDWESGMAWGKYFAACMRHLWAWWRGKGVDEESGLSHLAHAACCVVFLITYEARGVGEDDRKGR